MRIKAGVIACVVAITACMTFLWAAPASAACVDHNTENPTLGKVEVCVNGDGSGEASWSTWDDNGTHRLYVLFGPDYVGVCRDFPDPANCTP